MSIFDQFRFSFVFLGLPEMGPIAILKTPSGSISFNSWLRCHRIVYFQLQNTKYISKRNKIQITPTCRVFDYVFQILVGYFNYWTILQTNPQNNLGFSNALPAARAL